MRAAATIKRGVSLSHRSTRKETRDHSPVLHDGLSALRYLVAHAAHEDQLLDEVDKEEAAAHHDLGQRLHAGVQAGEALADLKLWFTP